MKSNYSHVSNRNVWSHCIVSLHEHSKGLSLSLDFKTYLSEESGAKLEELYEELRLLLKFAQVESIIQDKH